MIGYIFNIFLHILFATFWVGGMLYLAFIVVPSIKKSPDRKEILYKTGLKFRFFGWISLLGLFITGLINMSYRNMNFSWDFFTQTSIGKTLFIKILLYVVMLSILAIHDFHYGEKAVSKQSDKNTNRFAKITGYLSLLLSLFILVLGILISRGFSIF
jgi:uncharacterized membrane protein